jgi:SAM-dependent methyltransferase
MKPYELKPPVSHRSRFGGERILPIMAALALGMAGTPLVVLAADPGTGVAPTVAPAIDPGLVQRWEARYQGDQRPAWDTGRPSSNLKRLVEKGTLPPCRVVELGCGTGVNAVYLAEQGFEVTAIDVAPTALNLAKKRAGEAGVTVEWIQADVLAPPPLGTFDLVFDRGCYHGVRRQDPARYVGIVKKLCRPGGRLLILAGNANEPGQSYGPPRVDEQDLIQDFAASFDLEELRETRFDTADADAQGALAWSVLLRRKTDAGSAP